jgi:hypothetical protein
MSGYIIVSDFEDDEDGVLYWSNEDGWGHRATATVFAETNWDLPMESLGWVKVSPFFQEGVSEGPPPVDQKESA